MEKVLFISANPKAAPYSNSLTVGEEFLSAYTAQHPDDVIERLDLYATDLQEIDADTFSAWGKYASGAHGEVTPAEAAKIQRMGVVLDQFLEFDKYIIATPMWNFSFPPRVKTYIDSLCIVNRTFKYTEQGPVGLLQGKKEIHIHASGGVYSQGPAAGLNFADNYLKAVFGFMGISDFTTIVIEGTAQFPGEAEAIKTKAITEARELAGAF
jgi:FMN-dependent NADH-azoreductase